MVIKRRTHETMLTDEEFVHERAAVLRRKGLTSDVADREANKSLEELQHKHVAKFKDLNGVDWMYEYQPR